MMNFEETSLLGEKYQIMKQIAYLHKELGKVNIKLERIKKKQVFKILKGQKKK